MTKTEMSAPIDPNRYLTFNTQHLTLRLDQEDGYLYISDHEQVISVPPNNFHALQEILDACNKLYTVGY